jgi:hypothetical protein
MVKAIEKGTKMMVESTNYINNMSLVLVEKQSKIYDKMLEKQLQYFNSKDEANNYT